MTLIKRLIFLLITFIVPFILFFRLMHLKIQLLVIT